MTYPGALSEIRPIGLISGLGPLAGSDVLSKMLAHAATRFGAVEDDEYPDIVLISHGITDFDFTGGPSAQLEAELVAMVREIDQHKPVAIGVACNTAHLYLASMRDATDTPIVDLIDETACAAAAAGHAPYLILSSSTTRRTRLYHRRLAARGVSFVEVTAHQQRVIDHIIHLVMAHDLDEAAARIAAFVGPTGTDFNGIVAGCTELPLALDRADLATPVVDSNRVLAASLVDRYYAALAAPSLRRQTA